MYTNAVPGKGTEPRPSLVDAGYPKHVRPTAELSVRRSLTSILCSVILSFIGTEFLFDHIARQTNITSDIIFDTISAMSNIFSNMDFVQIVKG